MLIAHLSDSHIRVPGQLAYGVVPSAGHLARCVAHINHFRPRPDLVLVTGDITYSGHEQEARHAAAVLSRLEPPWYVIPGNHDRRQVIERVFSGTACPPLEGGFANYLLEEYPLRLIALDSTRPGAPGGEICSARAAWLEACLERQPERPTLLFMHHPPLRCSVPETDEDGFIGAERLGGIVQRHPNIVAILCGHVHFQFHACWRGVQVSSAPSMGMQLDLELTLERPSRFLAAPPGYLLHRWSPDRGLISYGVPVDAAAGGPHEFEE